MRGGSGGGGCSCCCGGDPPADESRSGLARSAAARASQSGEAESLIGIDLNEVRYNDDDDLPRQNGAKRIKKLKLTAEA